MKETVKFQRGFTMVELLVAIAILAVLAALIFAGASKAVAAARSTTCANNLRQVGVVVHEIRAEGVENGWNGPGYFPPYAGHISGAGVPWRKFNIHSLIGEKAGFCEFRNGRYHWNVHPSETFLQDTLSEHQVCGDLEVGQVNADNFSFWGSFGYNSLIERWVAPHSIPGHARMSNLATMDYPTLTIMMGQINPRHGDVPVWMGPWDNVCPQGEYQDRARCLFVDGHVEAVPNELLMTSKGRETHLWLDRGYGYGN